MTDSIMDETVKAIWRAHGLGAVRRIARVASGISNACFIVNDDRVIRFNTFDMTVPKFENERVAYDLLAGSGLPVPSVIVLDASRQVVPYDCIILTRLPGTNLAESWRDLTPAQIHDLVWEAGRCLARLHTMAFPAFGKLREQDAPRFRSWLDYFNDYVHRYLSEAARYSLLNCALHTRLEATLARSQSLLARVARGVLVHSDYHYENILQRAGRLTGILDFEWALSADPTYDFMSADVREGQIPGSEAAFRGGYRSARSFDAEHEQRLAVYRLFLRLETAVMHTQRNNPPGAQSALAAMIHLLEIIEEE
ncbi:MAG: phosphotransferase family protein [Thermomicrobiales bacterium]